MKYEHYFDQPLEMVERVLNKKLIIYPELLKIIEDMDLTLYLGR